MASFKKYTDKTGSELWMFQAYLGIDPATGKKVKTTRRGFKRKKEAQLALNRLKLDFDKSGLARSQVFTYQELYEQWLVGYRVTVKNSTLATVQRLFTNRILPAFGNRCIDKITLPYTQKVVNQWAKELASYRQVLTYAGMVFQYALKLDLIVKDPSKLVTHPKPKAAPGPKKFKLADDWENYYTKEELQRFFDCLDDNEKITGRHQVSVFFKVMALTGMRDGEQLALKWSNVDLVNNVINVRQTLAKGTSGACIQSPKTPSSNRSINIDDDTARLLKKWQLIQRQQLLMTGYNVKAHADQLVFTNRKNTFLAQTTVQQWLVHIIEKYHLKYIRIHGLRHTYASLLFESHASIKAMQKLMGHSNIQTTMNIYTHLSETTKQETVENMSKYVNS
ncbi:site-specific integrase [Secundilactobacillus similis]|uniref:Tyr recombinase domain-containing protein n=1 Tax=Secundilactobacillus similis DSM 23365 = JCM 2765 TaxID=1423804 RepID=A0A0R2EGH7_9LACO|nr:site-specific integrase [Secundilactobacillus similis]KRN15504.1 hypothetical protein FD14_GL002843 [Secundilactobacillus similis DSM 23365 = JCM 2765]